MEEYSYASTWPKVEGLHLDARGRKRLADSFKSEAKIWWTLVARGDSPRWVDWVSVNQKCAVWCGCCGRVSRVVGNSLRAGRGSCNICGIRKKGLALAHRSDAEQRYRDLLARWMHTPLWESWSGAEHPHKIWCGTCAEVRMPCPTVPLLMGTNPCGPCGQRRADRTRSARAGTEQRFRTALAVNACELVSPWTASHSRHDVRCSSCGELRSVLPSSILSAGTPPCAPCKGRRWDVFYVVMDESVQVLKLGITSTPSRKRIGEHRRSGYETVIRLNEGLPGDVAPVLERTILAALADLGAAPVHGREYFEARWMPTVQRIADEHLAPFTHERDRTN